MGRPFDMYAFPVWAAHASYAFPVCVRRYRAAVAACALEPDFAALPEGDRTVVGEGGLTLSGGQRARMALARAVYARAPLVLVDDMLCTLDAATRAHVWRECLVGAMAGRTRVVVTTDARCLGDAAVDGVVVVEGGGAVLLDARGGEWAARRAALAGVGADAVPPPAPPAAEASVAAGGGAGGGGRGDRGRGGGGCGGGGKSSSLGGGGGKSASGGGGGGKSASGAEAAAAGAIPWRAVRTYLRAYGGGVVGGVESSSGGGGVLWAVGFAYVVAQALSTGAAWWLSVWSDGGAGRGPLPGRSLAFYVSVYGGLGVCVCAVSLCRVVVMTRGALRASTALHNGMLRSVLRAPLAWHDANGAGRALNRFVKDVATVDSDVRSDLSQLIQVVLQVRPHGDMRSRMWPYAYPNTPRVYT